MNTGIKIITVVGTGIATLVLVRNASAATQPSKAEVVKTGEYIFNDKEAFNIGFNWLEGFSFDSLVGYKKPKTEWDNLIATVEKENGIPAGLLHRQLQKESNFNPFAVNPNSGAQGLAQLLPRWHPKDGQINGYWEGDLNPFDPRQVIPYAGRYMKKLYNRFGDWGLALAAYNWGEGSVNNARNKPLSSFPAETQDYVVAILTDVPVQSKLV